MDAPIFLPGMELNRRFFFEIVQPLLTLNLPSLPYSAGILGAGSEVLGFDTPMSRDHDWGPRTTIFLPENVPQESINQLEQTLRASLPETFLGYPVQWQIGGPSEYRCVEITDIHTWFQQYLGVAPWGNLQATDWLAFPQQKLRTIACGEVFHDALELQNARDALAWYPHDVWLYLLAAGWQRIGQEEHLMGRVGFVGDELGSVLIAARLVRDVMRLSFLMERVYTPYPKWFGTAFSHLTSAPLLTPHLSRTLKVETWQERQQSLAAAYELLAAHHNTLGLTEPLATHTRLFFDRPFLVLDAGRFCQALVARISDPAVKGIATNGLEGSFDQFSDNTDLLNHTHLWKHI